MKIKTVAILSPGDMGHAVGRVLREHGIDVVTYLEGRSDRTRGLARQAGIREFPNLQELVVQSDLILSIVASADAPGVARRIATVVRARHAATLFADCNAISPRVAQELDAIITSAGGRFIDASIIGGPPSESETPRFYASGPYAGALAELDGMGIQVRLIGDQVGRASGLKMCFAALGKGTHALYITLLAAAEVLGLTDELQDELRSSTPGIYESMVRGIPSVPSKARRWVSEMEEIAAAFEQVGVTPYFPRGAADVFRAFHRTPFAGETPQTWDRNRTLEQTIGEFVRALPKKAD